MPQSEVVFMRFPYSHSGKNRWEYFVGSSEEAILRDTANGTGFGMWKYGPGREVVSYSFVQELRFEYFDDGVQSVREGRARSYFLGIRSEDPASA